MQEQSTGILKKIKIIFRNKEVVENKPRERRQILHVWTKEKEQTENSMSSYIGHHQSPFQRSKALAFMIESDAYNIRNF